VFTYKEEWERFSERIGYWLDYSRAYVTFHTPYIESVWAVLKTLAERGLLYRGHKSVPYCPRCGTALSSHEVAQGYEEVEDPSLHFLCHWVDEDGAPDPEGRSFLVWTTTPWTVPSNAALAVDPELEYARWRGPTRGGGAEAGPRRGPGGGGLRRGDAGPERRWTGRELLGMRYARPLDLVPLDGVEPEERSPPAGGWWTRPS
jgi:isoleucyl-tRNA synthetase